MTASPAHSYSPKTALCASAKPNRLVGSSASAGWRSLHLDHCQGAGEGTIFDTNPTDDLTLVVNTAGTHEVGLLAGGQWRFAVYQAGSAGLTPPGESVRLRWRTSSDRDPFETVHIYLPGSLAADVAEEYRRAGQPARVDGLSSLAFRDPIVASHATVLLQAAQEGQPDLFAAGAARWLVTHLLAQHPRWRDLSDDARMPATITDRRLRRVTEYMSAHLASALTIDELAREAGISAHHFGRRFREATGMGPARFLTTLRMGQAKLLLRTTDLSIADISLRCGYGSASAFGAAFLRHIGITATAYRAA